MGKHEEKEGGRQYIRSILTLTVIFNSAPRFAKWAEFLCSPRTYSFQIGYVFSTWFSILHLFFSCNSRTKSPRKDNNAHCCQNFYPQYWLSCHFCFSLDSFSAFASHGKEAMSQVLHCTSKRENIHSHIWNSFWNFTSAAGHLMMKAPCDPYPRMC